MKRTGSGNFINTRIGGADLSNEYLFFCAMAALWNFATRIFAATWMVCGQLRSDDKVPGAGKRPTPGKGLLRRQEAGFDDLQIVVLGKLAHKVKGHRLDLAQPGIDHHRLDAVDDGWTNIGRVLQMRIAPATLGIETGHHSAQAFGPITGAKLLAIAGETKDEELV